MCDEREKKEIRTLLNQILLVIDDADILLSQILNRLICHLPQLLRHLADEACKPRKYDVSGVITE